MALANILAAFNGMKVYGGYFKNALPILKD